MHIFGNRTSVRIALFEADKAPKAAKLKKIFSCSSAKVYKGCGHYRSHINQIEAVLKDAADLRGSNFQKFPWDLDIVIMDDSAQYNVFTIATYCNDLIGMYKLDVDLNDRLEYLCFVKDRVRSGSKLCPDFIQSVYSINRVLDELGISDPVSHNFDPNAFVQQYGDCGRQGLLGVRALLAKEASNLIWEAGVPAYQGDESTPEASSAVHGSPPIAGLSLVKKAA